MQGEGDSAMSFVQPGSNSKGRSVGITIAIAFHVALIWALANGLGRQVAKAIAAPLETFLVEDVKPPPPPPKAIEMPPPPKFTPPPPVYIPPPEVQVQVPPAPAPTITATVAEVPPAPPSPAPTPAPRAVPVVPAPPAPPPPAPAPVAPPAPVSASVACSNYAQVMGDASFPREALRLGLDEGHALIQFTLGVNGEIKDVKAVSASHPVFAKASSRIVGEYKCKGTGRDVTVQVPFSFRSS
jgi:protein TonB